MTIGQTSLPPQLRAAVRRHDLGGLEQRVRHRPSIWSTIGVVFLVIAAAEFARADVTAPISIAALVVAPIVAAYWLFTTRSKLRGGLFVFQNGIADVYGRYVQTVLTYREISRVSELTTIYLLNLIPVGQERECTITATRAGQPIQLKLTSAYKDMKSVTALVRLRSREARVD
jgi:hypothetical protein